MDSTSAPVARSITGKYEAALAPMMPSKKTHDPRNAVRNPPRGSRLSSALRDGARGTMHLLDMTGA